MESFLDVSLRDVIFYLPLSTVLLISVLFVLNRKVRYLCWMTLFYICMGLCAVITTIILTFRPNRITNNRIVGWVFLHLTSWWTKINWEFKGLEILDNDNPCVIMANHQSSLDLQGMMKMFPKRCVVLIKEDLLYNPFFGYPAYLSCNVFVPRHNTKGAVQKLRKAVDLIKNDRLKLWVFPEGQRNHKNTGLLPFKKGAFHLAIQAQIPIIPVVCSSFVPFYSRKEMKFSSGGLVVGQVLGPIPTQGLTGDDVDVLTQRTRQLMLDVYEEISTQSRNRMIQ